jgi:hypothetical protein
MALAHGGHHFAGALLVYSISSFNEVVIIKPFRKFINCRIASCLLAFCLGLRFFRVYETIVLIIFYLPVLDLESDFWITYMSKFS